MRENKLMKNNTYNSLINKKSNKKNNCQLYNYTTPNKNLKKIVIFLLLIKQSKIDKINCLF